MRRYKISLEKKNKSLGEATEWHIREVIREKVNIRVEGDLNVSLNELDRIY